ncbi:MAG: hypothetical protein IT258_03555 [Saprospiraceae bacterium]|nr:hypothetical protein [Saprospiraceae bacterium]
MKINLLLAFFTAVLFSTTPVNSLAAASSIKVNASVLPNAQVAAKTTTAKLFKKEKRHNRLRTWWAKQTNKLRNAWKWMQRISLGFVGFIVMLVGGLFIVLGIVIPVVGVLFLVLGIIIAFVGLLLWLILSRIGVRVSNDGGSRRPH